MSKFEKKWVMNLCRAVDWLGGVGNAVRPVWTDGHRYHNSPPKDEIRRSGYSLEDRDVYDTEEAAWAALLAEFDAWCAERRAKIVEAARKAKDSTRKEAQ